MKYFSVLLSLFLIASVMASSFAQDAAWVCCLAEGGLHSDDSDSGGGFGRKAFSIAAPVSSVKLRAVGYATFVDIYLDGTLLHELEPYDPIFQIDVTDRCRQGEHLLAIKLEHANNPCAAFVQLDILFADGTRTTIATDRLWRGNQTHADGWDQVSFDDSAWMPMHAVTHVDARLLIPREHSTEVGAVENYDQWKQALSVDEGTDPASFMTIDGFDIELIRSAHEDEDSWVSLVFDPQGRVIISKEEVGLLRMTLDAGGVTEVEVIDDTMQECRGLLFIGDDLYVNANESKGLYCLHKNATDGYDPPQLVYESSGSSGHGRNDLTLASGRMIYSIHGDSVDLPESATDWTSPYRDARRGNETSEGHLLAIDPGTKKVSILVAGLRNPFGVAVNQRGDIFTYDADAEYDMGAPWYRPTRVNHLVAGGDYGWRGVTKSWPPYYPDHPDNAMPGLDIGKGSPTAIKFATSSNFPARYREALFILDWTYGRVIAVHLFPRGASYLMSAETFLQGKPLNVTDIDFGPDGAMYLLTGGRKTQSALYRVCYNGKEKDSADKPLGVPPSRGTSPVRPLQELSLGSAGAKELGRIWKTMASLDPVRRSTARNMLERIDVSLWQEKALQEPAMRVALTALLCLARQGDADNQLRILGRLNELDWSAGTRSQREMAAYTYWLCTKDRELETKLVADVIAKIDHCFPDRYFCVNRLLTELLVRLESKSAVDRIMPMAIASTGTSQQMHYLFVLRAATQGWTLPVREHYFRLINGMKDYPGGRGMNEFITKIRSDAVATLSPQEKKSLAAVIELADDAPLEQTASAPREFVRQWSTAAVLSAYPQDLAGDASRGAGLFAAAQCIHCHRFAGRGRSIGPDLTDVSRRFSNRDLIDAIVSPSKVIPEKYQSLQVVTVDGNVVVGQVALRGDYRSTVLRLATDPMQPNTIKEINKDEIESQRPAKTSWMPKGLLDTLSSSEIADLLAYLNSTL